MPRRRIPGPRPCARGVAADELQLELLRHVDARILQQRGDIVGGRAEHGVLEVEQPDPRSPSRPASQSRFGEWKSRRTQVGGGVDRRAAPRARGDELGAGGAGQVAADDVRQVPVEQKLGLDQQGVES